MSEVKITRKGQQRIADGHLWIYRSDLISQKKEPVNGSIVKVLGWSGKRLGQAFYSAHSQIALRMIGTKDDLIDKEFWRARLAMAAQLRRELVRDTDAYRLLHGEGDLIPSLVIDRYRNYFVIQMLTQGTDKLKSMWVELLTEMFQPMAIIERDDVKVRELEGLPLQIEVLTGEAPQELILSQNGIKFAVDLISGQKTGLFLDQRENHEMVERYARGRTLDCFTFVGAFAMHMAKVADEVVGLDISEAAIAQARRNAHLNQFYNLRFEVTNVFDRLKTLDEQKEQYDTVVLDPPAFAKSRSAIESASRGYKEINLRAMKLLKPGGILITCTCSFNIGEEAFLEILKMAAIDAGRKIQLLEKRTQSRDHPILLTVPETYYLKCMVLRVL